MATYEVNFSALGAKIKQLRLLNNLTQEKFAEKIGITDKFLSRIEQNRSKCSINVLLSIANTFNIGIDTLLAEQLYTYKDKPINELSSVLQNKLNTLTDKEKQYILKTIDLLKELND